MTYRGARYAQSFDVAGARQGTPIMIEDVIMREISGWGGWTWNPYGSQRMVEAIEAAHVAAGVNFLKSNSRHWQAFKAA
jgi:hypothetical protein